jgi:hypothetical protein
MGRLLPITPARRLALAWVGVAIAAVVFVPGALAVFSTSATVSANAFTTGTITLTDDDAGSAILALSVAHPGDSASGCMKVSYSGSLTATTRLYATTTGTGLDAYLTLKVTRGTVSSGSFPSCSGFTADGTNYIGSGNGVVYSGTLSSFPGTYAAGLVDPTSGSPASWTNGTVHAYKLTVTLPAAVSSASRGKNTVPTFSWEAR